MPNDQRQGHKRHDDGQHERLRCGEAQIELAHGGLPDLEARDIGGIARSPEGENIDQVEGLEGDDHPDQEDRQQLGPEHRQDYPEERLALIGPVDGRGLEHASGERHERRVAQDHDEGCPLPGVGNHDRGERIGSVAQECDRRIRQSDRHQDGIEPAVRVEEQFPCHAHGHGRGHQRQQDQRAHDPVLLERREEQPSDQKAKAYLDHRGCQRKEDGAPDGFDKIRALEGPAEVVPAEPAAELGRKRTVAEGQEDQKDKGINRKHGEPDHQRREHEDTCPAQAVFVSDHVGSNAVEWTRAILSRPRRFVTCY